MEDVVSIPNSRKARIAFLVWTPAPTASSYTNTLIPLQSPPPHTHPVFFSVTNLHIMDSSGSPHCVFRGLD